MATSLGEIESFVFEAESFIEWTERLEQWFVANDIEDAGKQRALFLSKVGARGYKLVRSLAQNDPKSKSYDELKKLMLDHLQPKPNEIAQRYVFYKRDRRAGESVNEYVAELRKLSEHCNFANNLEENLRDKFVCGLNDEKVQQKLLATKGLTLKMATDTAIVMEAAARSAKQIHSNSAVHVNKFGHSHGHSNRFQGHNSNSFSKSRGGGVGNQQGNPKSFGTKKKECYRCGSLVHLGDSCPFKSLECFKCGKIGHKKGKCRKGQENQNNRRQGKINWEGTEEMKEESGEDFDLSE